MLPDPPADGPVPARPEAPVRALATGLAVLRSLSLIHI